MFFSVFVFVDFIDFEGWIVLWLVVWGGYMVVVCLLLDMGVEVNYVDKD